MQYKEDNKKDYSHVVQKMIEVEKEGNSIETKQKKELDIIDEEKEKGMIRKGIVKEMLERIERQQCNSTLTNSKDRTLRKELDIGKEREIMKKEKERYNNDSLEKVVNKEEKDNNSKKSNSLKKEIDERLKSIERSITYTQDNGLAKLAKKIEILNSPLEIDRKRDITILNNTKLSENEKTDRHIRNTICHKCKQYGHTKKQCDRHNKIVKQISKLEFEKDVINE